MSSRLGSSRWLRRLVAALVALDLAAAGGVLLVSARDSTTPVDVESAVDRFRAGRASTTPTTAAVPGAPGASGTAGVAASPGAAPAPGGTATATTAPPASVPARRRALPAEGVYVYATTGGEEVDVLGGARHRYPERTTVALTHVDCGVRMRWEPIEERWDEDDWCHTPAGIESGPGRTHHEFFGVSDDQSFTCDAGSLVLPADPAPGATWATVCRSGETTSQGTGTVVGTEVLDVGGRQVTTVHVRFESATGGDNEGVSRRDDWLVPETGLVVRRESFVETKSDSPFGTTTYTEEYTLVLEALDPRT